MLAVGLTVALFAYWIVVGYAVCAWLNAERDALVNLLLAPAVGVALTLIPLFFLNRMGLPVRRFGVPLFVVLLVGSVVSLWFRRPGRPPRDYWLCFAVILLAVVVTGSPLFTFGFDWVAYCNDDMANYCLGAQRLYEHGLYDLPDTQTVVAGRDYSAFYFVLHVMAMSRAGVELVLAWTRSLTHQHEHALFMPLILAFHLVLVSSAGALAMHGSDKENRRAGFVTCLLMTLSAMTTLGTIYQVVAQVAGLGLMAAGASVVLRPFEGLRRPELARHGLLAAVLGVALALVYPEVLPFFAVSFLLYVALAARRGRKLPVPLLTMAAVGALVATVVLNAHLQTVFNYLRAQVAGGTTSDDVSFTLMPYFLVPRGLANFWGLQSLARFLPEPLLSMTIGAGLLMLLMTAAGAVWLAVSRGNRAATFVVVMLGVGLYLFHQRTGFGLFKLSMFLQPFLLATIVAACFALWRTPVLRYTPLALVAALGLWGQQQYIRDSYGYGAKFSLVPRATPSHLVGEFREIVRRYPDRPLVSDTFNIALAKFQALHAQGQPIAFLGDTFFKGITDFTSETTTAQRLIPPVRELMVDVEAQTPLARFQLNNPSVPGALNRFRVVHLGIPTELRDRQGNPVPPSPAGAPFAQQEPILVMSTGDQGVLNRRHLPENTSDGNFVAKPISRVSNHLIFVNSSRGRPFYAHHERLYGLYQLEDDPMFFRGTTMSALGRHSLLQVLNPSGETVRLAMNLSATYLKDARGQLPDQAAGVGQERQPLGLLGRGSARIFSPPLKPQLIDGRYYVEVDLNDEGRQFVYPRTGLMGLYGRDVSLDRRKLTVFARDISVISEAEFQKLDPPSALQYFPNDLLHPDLQYSGLYEDGWLSEAAYFNLRQRSRDDTLTLKVQVPQVGDRQGFETEMTVLVDGSEVGRKTLRVGPAEVRLTVPPVAGTSPAGGIRRVELRFSATQDLPGESRPAAAALTFVAFQPGGPSTAVAKGK